MEIERVNENTVKFYMSYTDIEERGFSREEVWYNREKSEELFWDMMAEINEESDFIAEGPLWIQVHAMNNGIEVTVTRTSMTEENATAPQDGSAETEASIAEKEALIEDLINQKMEERKNKKPTILNQVFKFNEFDDVLALVNRLHVYPMHSSLYAYENQYYLYVCDIEKLLDKADRLDVVAIIQEYAQPATITVPMLEEYGTIVLAEDVFHELAHYFL